MKVVVIGTGYVGLVQGVCLAEHGNDVTCVDIDEKKVALLKKGISPIYEPGIEELIKKNLKAKRIEFTTTLKSAIKDSEVVFIAVGTPSDKDGRADLQYVLAAAAEIGRNLTHYQVIVNKSTVPIGTGKLVEQEIVKYYSGKFAVVSNPEFLREGTALEDFMQPDRVVIGDSHDGKAAKVIAELYAVLNCPVLITDLETAEMIKYASNSFLANEISFINFLSRVCEKVGANVDEVAAGMKLDNRIGRRAFLSAGIGYGGSCFPKDVAALIQIAAENGEDFKILRDVEDVNAEQKRRFADLVVGELGGVKGKTVAVWGLAFKPKTDDLRYAPSITLVGKLLEEGAKVRAYDPVASSNFKKLFPDIHYCETALEACKDADALAIVTEWDEFRQLDLKEVKRQLKGKMVFDGRNIYKPDEMKKLGFDYFCIGKKKI